MQFAPPQLLLHTHALDRESHTHWLPPQSLSVAHTHDDSTTQASVANGLADDGIILKHTLSDTGAPVVLVHCTARVCTPGMEAQLGEEYTVDAAAVQAPQGPTLHATMALAHMKRLQGRCVDCAPGQHSSDSTWCIASSKCITMVTEHVWGHFGHSW